MGLINEIAAQNPIHPPRGDAQSGAAAQRFSQLGASGWRVYRSGITASEIVTDLNPLIGVQVPNGNRVQWLVLRPPGVTSYQVSCGRVISTAGRHQDTKGFAITAMHVDSDGVDSGLTGVSFDTYQQAQGDRVFCAITTIAGAPTPWPAGPPATPGATVVEKVNGAPPDGFVILYRSAAPE